VTNDNALIEEHDISPDGEWIIHDSNLRGNMDIYKRPSSGGAAIPLTNSPGDEFSPNWSPDGTEITFFGEAAAGVYTVMVVSADGGTPIQISSGAPLNATPRWSPSGLEIAFWAQQGHQRDTWIVARDSVGGSWGEPTQLTDFGCRFTDWAPDGNGVLCSEPDSTLALVSGEGEVLWRYDPSTDGLLGCLFPSFSPDGSTIYAPGRSTEGTDGIWALSPEGGEPRLVVAFDAAEMVGLRYFSVTNTRDSLYLTVQEAETDIWVADVMVER
jgi:Tol biopolymer transport system component